MVTCTPTGMTEPMTRKESGIQEAGSWEGQMMGPDLERSRQFIWSGRRELRTRLAQFFVRPGDGTQGRLAHRSIPPACRAGEEGCRLRTERI